MSYSWFCSCSLFCVILFVCCPNVILNSTHGACLWNASLSLRMLKKEKVYKITRPLVRAYFYLFFSVLGLHVTSVLFSNLPLLQTFSLFSCLEMRNNLLSDCFCVCLCTRTLMLLGRVKVPQDQYRRTQPDTRFVEEWIRKTFACRWKKITSKITVEDAVNKG